MSQVNHLQYLGMAFTVFSDDHRIKCVDDIPNVVIFRDKSLGEVPFSINVTADVKQCEPISTRDLLDNETVEKVRAMLADVLTNWGYEDFIGSYEPKDSLERAFRQARWDINELAVSKTDPLYIRNRLGRLGTNTSKLFGTMSISPTLNIMLFRRLPGIDPSASPIGKWTSCEETGYVMASNAIPTSTNWFAAHLAEDLSQLEQDFANEFSLRWPNYPGCTFKLFNEEERRTAYRELSANR